MNFILILILINVAVYILPYVVDFSKGMYSSNDSFIMMFWQQADQIKSGEYYRLITSQFLHADVMHIFLNMYTLWQVRSYALGMSSMLLLSRANSYLTPFIFLFVYLTSGVLGGLLSVFTSDTPSVGASGAILGILGFMTSYALYVKDNELLTAMLINVLILAAIGFLVPRINNAAHFGGFATGFVLYFVLLYAFKFSS
jgi:rhomboid protease GluP